MNLEKKEVVFYVDGYKIVDESDNLKVEVTIITEYFMPIRTKMKVLDIEKNDLKGVITKVECDVNKFRRKYTVTLDETSYPSLGTIFKTVDPNILLNAKIIQI